jgi:hypothetical protein
LSPLIKVSGCLKLSKIQQRGVASQIVFCLIHTLFLMAFPQVSNTFPHGISDFGNRSGTRDSKPMQHSIKISFKPNPHVDKKT